MDIKDGLVDFEKKVAVQLTDVNWLGTGEINLKTEKLDAGFVPKPRKGIGISVGSLASLIHIGGTLKHPRMEIDPKDVALKYGKFMATVGTGGLALLAGAVINKATANEDLCEQILDSTVIGDEEATGQASTEKGTAEQAGRNQALPTSKNFQ